MQEPDSPRWYDFIGHRRQGVPDGVWYALAFIAMGVGGLTDFGGSARWLGVLSLLAGLALLGWLIQHRITSDR